MIYSGLVSERLEKRRSKGGGAAGSMRRKRRGRLIASSVDMVTEHATISLKKKPREKPTGQKKRMEHVFTALPCLELQQALAFSNVAHPWCG